MPEGGREGSFAYSEPAAAAARETLPKLSRGDGEREGRGKERTDGKSYPPPLSLFVLPGKPFLRYRPSLCSMAGSFSFEFQLVGGNFGLALIG